MKILTRRKFFKCSALAATSLLIPDFLKGFAGTYSPENSFLKNSLKSGNKLIVIQLSGGNDGLNTVIPYKNDIYYEARQKISISENKVLKITDEAGLNPEMNMFREIFDKGNLCIVNSVGYPNPDRSHFRSMDIWQSGSSSDEYVSTGWLGRYLDSDCTGCDNPYNAIAVDPNLAMALKGNKRSGMAVENPQRFYMNTTEKYFLELAEQTKIFRDDNNVSYLYKTLAETTSSADYIYENSKIYKSKRDYPDTAFGKNLKTISEMINSDIDTSVYYVSLSGFDTHVNQNGRQERLLKEYSEGVYSLTEDLRESGMLGSSLIMTFSEFGRRVKQNAGGGTDHGTANNLFLIGGNLKTAGLYNSMPDLSNLESGDLKFEIDFRSVYSTILRNWLNADDRKIMGKEFEMLGIV
ncbi:MAG: hypothetical protein HGGPFJEG_00862 [Ignavibacteria bacterium]|nr:hypothetical protein [Ignavibacteria bacterium]